LWVPVAVAVLLQALLFFAVQPEIAFDSASYMTQAESIASTGAARNAAGEPDTVRTPGYPLFLAAFLAARLGYPGAIAVQHLLWIFVVAGITSLSFQLTRRQTVAVVAGMIAAIDLPALQATNAILTETWATVFVSLAAWQAYRSAQTGDVVAAVIAGLFAGVAAFIRPVAILLGVPLALAIVVAGAREYRVRAAAVLLMSSLVIPAAWTARNYLQTGVATFSSIGSINLLLYRAAGTLAIRDPGGVDANIQRRQAELDAVACRTAERRFGRACAAIPITQRATLYRGLAMPVLLADPVGVLMQAARAFVMIMFGGGANMMSGLTGLPESATRMIAFTYTVPLAILAVLGVGYWRRVDRLAMWLMLLTMAYLVVMSLGVEAYSRFRVPFLPLYAMLAGGGVAFLRAR
jgi:hypothetical protein